MESHTILYLSRKDVEKVGLSMREIIEARLMRGKRK